MKYTILFFKNITINLINKIAKAKIINQLCEKEQELITYLKEEIKEYEEKCNNTCVFLEQDRCETRINTYKEILSKIEKSDK